MRIRVFALLLLVVTAGFLQSAHISAASHLFGVTSMMLETINDDLLVNGNVIIEGPTPWADIRAFGAVADDTTADTTAIQNAINSLGSGGGVVYIPRGQFYTAGNVVSNNNVRIVGAGRGSILRLTGAGTLLRFSGSDGGVEDLLLECAAISGSTGLRLAGVNDNDTGVIVGFNTFSNLRINSCTTGILLRATENSGTWYNNFSTIHVYGSGVGVLFQGVTGGQGPNRNNFFAVRIGGYGSGTGIRIEAGNTNTFYGTSLEGLSTLGIFVDDVGPDGAPTDGNRFYGTTFEAVGSPTINEIDNQNPDTQFLGNVGIDPFSTINYYGNVGIGTGTDRPRTKLHVEAGGPFDNSNAESGLLPAWGGVTLSGKYWGESVWHANGGLRANGFQPYGGYSGGISLQRFYYTGGSPTYAYEDVLNVTGSGNVGIGVTNPSYKFHVNGTAGATSWNVISSRTFKENVQKLEPGRYRDMLTQLQGIDLSSYRYKTEYSDDTRPHVGLIAEDLPETLLSKDGKSVNLYELTSFAIGAMKAQQDEIKGQQERLDTQAQEIETLKATVDRLVKAVAGGAAVAPASDVPRR